MRAFRRTTGTVLGMRAWFVEHLLRHPACFCLVSSLVIASTCAARVQDVQGSPAFWLPAHAGACFLVGVCGWWRRPPGLARVTTTANCMLLCANLLQTHRRPFAATT